MSVPDLPFRTKAGLRFVGHRNVGEMHCSACGSMWRGKNRQWWPLRLSSSKRWALGRHGFEVGPGRVSEIFFATVISVGPLRIIFGDRRREGVPELDMAVIMAVREAEEIAQ